MTPDIEIFVGATSPNVTFTVQRGSTPVDLTGATVNFKLFNPNTKLQSNTGNELCTIVTPTAGTCVYSWGNSDIPEAGVYRGYVEVTFPTGKLEIGDVRVNVKPVGF